MGKDIDVKEIRRMILAELGIKSKAFSSQRFRDLVKAITDLALFLNRLEETLQVSLPETRLAEAKGLRELLFRMEIEDLVIWLSDYKPKRKKSSFDSLFNE